MSKRQSNSLVDSQVELNRRSVPLIRIENLDPEVVLFSNTFEVSGRVFVPQELLTEKERKFCPEVELYLEDASRDVGSFASGLFLIAERIIAANSEQGAELLECRVNPVQVASQEVNSSGQWFGFVCEVSISQEQLIERGLILKVGTRISDRVCLSNGISLKYHSRSSKQLVWLPCSSAFSGVEYGRTALSLGTLLYPPADIVAIEVEGIDNTLYELEWARGGSKDVRRFVGCSPDELCRVSIIFDKEALPFSIGVPLYLNLLNSSGETIKVLIPRPIIEDAPLDVCSRIESIYLDSQNRINIRGWCIAPLEWRQTSIQIQTLNELLPLGRGRLKHSEVDTQRRDDIEYQFPGRTQTRPWGFNLKVYPHSFSGRDAMPQLVCVDDSSLERYPIGSKQDQQKIYQLICEQRSEDFSINSVAKGAVAWYSGLQSRSRFVPGRTRERIPGQYPCRLAFVSHNFSATEGAPKVLYELVKSISSSHPSPDLEILVLGGGVGDLERDYQALGVQTRVFAQLHCESHSIETFCSEMDKAAVELINFKPDCIYANTLPGFWGIELAQRLGVASLWAIHESKTAVEWGLELQPYYARKLCYYLANAAQLLFVADSSRKLISRWQSDAETTVVRNGVDLALIQSKCSKWSKSAARTHLGIQPEASVVSIIGTTTHRKGQDQFLRVAAALKQSQPERDYCFLVVGARESRYLDELKGLVAEFGLEQWIRFVPETKDVAPYFRATDVILMCSRQESAPLVSLEAFAYQCPLVSTSVFGLAEQLIDGKNSLVFEVEDVQGACRQVERILDDSKLRDSLIAGGIQSLENGLLLSDSMSRHWQQLCAAYSRSF